MTNEERLTDEKVDELARELLFRGGFSRANHAKHFLYYHFAKGLNLGFDNAIRIGERALEVAEENEMTESVESLRVAIEHTKKRAAEEA